MLKIKQKIFELLNVSETPSLQNRIVNGFITALIILNVLSVIFETVRSLYNRFSTFFFLFEVFSVIIFTVEYILRIWICNFDPKFSNGISGRIKFIFTPLAIVDLIAILPFYLPMIFPFDMRFIRILRLMRLARIFKLGRYSEALRTFGAVIKSKKEELFITAFVAVILLVISSSIMYFLENQAQPEAFKDIPSSMWWAVVTMATVGYGDVYPVTTGGKILGSIVAFFGIGLFAIPAGIIGSGFIEEIHKKQEKKKIICPHCGKEISPE